MDEYKQDCLWRVQQDNCNKAPSLKYDIEVYRLIKILASHLGGGAIESKTSLAKVGEKPSQGLSLRHDCSLHHSLAAPHPQRAQAKQHDGKVHQPAEETGDERE
jgi:hypothetical protein